VAKKPSKRTTGPEKKSKPAKPAPKPAAKAPAKAKPAPKPKPAAKPAPKPSAKPTPKPPAKPAPSKSKAPIPRKPEKTTSLKISKPPATAIAHQIVEAPEPPTTAQLRKIESGLTRQEKDAYRKALLEKRAEILGDVASLKDAALSSGGNLSNMPLHMADVGSDQFEQESMLGLVESERRLLREINEALVRLHEGTYGVCIESGKPIGKPRLDATPWAKYTIEVVREKERTGQR
jgi:RNA polymerase-binding transcription factor DksA